MAPPAARPAHRLRGRRSPRPADPPPRAWRPGTWVPAGPAGAPARPGQQRPQPAARMLAATPPPPGLPRLRDRDQRAAAASRPADRRGSLALSQVGSGRAEPGALTTRVAGPGTRPRRVDRGCQRLQTVAVSGRTRGADGDTR